MTRDDEAACEEVVCYCGWEDLGMALSWWIYIIDVIHVKLDVLILIFIYYF